MKSLTPSFECEVAAEGVAERTLKNAIYVGPPVARCVKGGPWKIQCLYAFKPYILPFYLPTCVRALMIASVLRERFCSSGGAAACGSMNVLFSSLRCMCGRIFFFRSP